MSDMTLDQKLNENNIWLKHITNKEYDPELVKSVKTTPNKKIRYISLKQIRGVRSSHVE